MGEQHSPGAVTEAPIAEPQVQVMFMLPHVVVKWFQLVATVVCLGSCFNKANPVDSILATLDCAVSCLFPQ